MREAVMAGGAVGTVGAGGAVGAVGTVGTVGALQGSSPQGSQLPLSFLGRGQKATIAKVRGRGELHHHLENLGFVEGASVMVVCENGGNLVVEIKGSQVALDKQVATKIITC